jgi:hypothetical protein
MSESAQGCKLNFVMSESAAQCSHAVSTERRTLWASAVVDTAFVGRLPGAEPLGGLAVATSVFTFTFLLFNFLSTVGNPALRSLRTHHLITSLSHAVASSSARPAEPARAVRHSAQWHPSIFQSCSRVHAASLLNAVPGSAHVCTDPATFARQST